LNNPNVNKYIGDELGKETTLENEEEWFAKYEKDETKKFFTVYLESTPIGIVGLSNISKQNRNANLFIIVGEDEYRGRGYGKDAMEQILDYGFGELKLHKINLGVVKENQAAVHLYLFMGFVIEGEMKDEVFGHGRFHDFLSMAMFNPKD
jgi:diamine N-acetyltransferase